MLDFNLGFPELVTLAVIGVLLFGPEKLPELARKAARLLNYLRGVANNATSQLRDELGPELTADLEKLNISDLHPKALVGQVLAEIEPAKDALTIAPAATVASVSSEVTDKPAPAVKLPEPAYDSEAT
jgi:sec-independent protein translocase protein TatB